MKMSAPPAKKPKLFSAPKWAKEVAPVKEDGPDKAVTGPISVADAR